MTLVGCAFLTCPVAQAVAAPCLIVTLTGTQSGPPSFNIRQIMRKLDAKNRTQAALRATRLTLPSHSRVVDQRSSES